MATREEIKAELKAKLGENKEENDKILRELGEKYAIEGDLDGLNVVGELLIENMPEERRQELERLTHIDGMRLDEYHKKIVDLINEGKNIEALPMAERLYKKILLDYGPTEKAKFVSLRNPFEDNLCQILFKDDRVLNRTPFDFATYITTYAFLLVSSGGNIDAIPILEKAIEYNPVDVGPRFELCEIYKIIRNKKMVLQTVRETLKVASSPVAIGRCYANVGYTLTDFGEYEDAGVFYFASGMFAPDPALNFELQHLADLKGSPVTKPSPQKVINTMKKYDIEYGPDRLVIEVVSQLAANFLKENNIPDALHALKMTYNLTLDESVKELILKLDPKSAMLRPKAEE